MSYSMRPRTLRKHKLQELTLLRSLILAVAVIMTSSLSVFAQEAMRTWSDKSGRFKIEARYVSEKDGVVTIKQKDGTELEIKLELLSKVDQAYVKNIADAANPFKKKGGDNPFMKKSGGSSTNNGTSNSTATEGSVIEEDFTKARDIATNKPTPGDWNLQLSGVEMLTKDDIVTIRIPKKTDFLEGVTNMAGTPNMSHALVGRKLEDRRSGRKSTTFVLVDLKKGKYAGQGAIEGALAPVDLHPSGEQVLARSESRDGPGKQELHFMKLGKKGLETIVKWKPYLHANKDRNVKWAKFVGENQVATWGADEQLVFWSIPDVKPLARFKMSWSTLPVVTSKRDYVVFHSEGQTGFIDVASHEIVASKDTPGLHGGRISVSPSGKRLAAASHRKLKVWDIATSELYREIDLNGIISWNKKLVWADDDHVVVGAANVIDIENRIQLWTYKDAHSLIGGGGYCWFFVNEFGRRTPGFVGATIPHDKAKAAMKDALASGEYFVLKPGSSVKVDASGISDSAKGNEARQKVEQRLTEAGFKIASDAEVTVTLSIGRGETQEITYRKFGAGFSGGEKHSFTPYNSSMQFMYKGKPAFSRGSSGGTPYMLHLKQGQSIADALRGYEKPYYGFFEKAEIPRYVPRPREDGKYTLGTTNLEVR